MSFFKSCDRVWMSCFALWFQALEYLPFEGTVSLKNPQHIFCLLEDYGTDPNNIPEHPNYIYFGRWVRCVSLLVVLSRGALICSWTLVVHAHQIADGKRELIRSHSVKNRHFIGNTSMDAGLSFIMANHAKVKENDLVYDPFVGTGKFTQALLPRRIQLQKVQHCISKHLVILCFSYSFREPAGCMFSFWSLRMWNRYWLQHYSRQRYIFSSNNLVVFYTASVPTVFVL